MVGLRLFIQYSEVAAPLLAFPASTSTPSTPAINQIFKNIFNCFNFFIHFVFLPRDVQ